MTFETMIQNFVEKQQTPGDVIFQEQVDTTEIIIIVEHVQVRNNIFIGDIFA